MDDKISIIVPIYNAEKTLRKCIEALVSQTYQNIEIILVNDGSDDSSLLICREYEMRDQRIKVIDKLNEGVSTARNYGIEVATGRFIMFCDSDDWAEPDWCEVLIANYEPGCLVMCGEYIEGEQKFLPYEVYAEKECERVPRIDFYELKMKLFNVLWNKIFLKSIIMKNQIKFEKTISNGEDLLFNVKYLGCISGDIIFLRNCGYHYLWPRATSLSKVVYCDYFHHCDYLFEQMKKAIAEIGCLNKKNEKIFFTDFFNEYQRGLRFVLNNKNLSLLQRRKRGNAIMLSENYQICAAKASISRNQVYNSLCRLKSCYGLWLWYTIWRKRYE